MAGRTLHPDELALWRRVMASVRPLRAVAPVAAQPAAPAPAPDEPSGEDERAPDTSGDTLAELRERAARRVETLHERGVPEARLYGHDPDDGVGGDGAFFLLLDEPEVYGLPPDPKMPSRKTR